MRRSALMLLLAGCATPCPSEPLSPLLEPPRFVLELTDFGAPGVAPLPPPDAIPGLEGEAPATPGAAALPEYASLAVYGRDGELLHERWLDTYSRWEGAADTYDARDGLPWVQAPGRLRVLLREVPSVAGLALASGAVAHDLRVPDGASMEADTFVDLAPVGPGGLSLLSHRDGRLSVLDLREDGAVLRSLDLAGTVGERVRAGRVAPLGDTVEAVVGLDVAGRGLVARVDVASGVVSLLELPGLRTCLEVAPLPSEPGRPARVAVLCLGEPDGVPELPLGAGLALLEASAVSPLALVAGRPLSTLFPGFVPTHALIGLHDGWVAVASRGGPERVDALLALDVTSDAGELLWQEAWTEQWGPGLGEGAFDPVSRELVWPSVRSGLLRFRQGAARFETLQAAPTSACFRLAPRRARYLP